MDRLRAEEERLIAEFYPRLAPRVSQLRTFPNFYILSVTSSDLDVMDDSMLQYHLRPRDALHVAAMRKCNCFDLRSHDSHFDRVPMISRYTLS